MSRSCPCGSSKALAVCCGPYLEGAAVPDTPEAMMRSRYTAFCLKNAAYLIETRYPPNRQPDERQQLEATLESTTWIGLKIVRSAIDPDDPSLGVVEFSAFYEANGVKQLHEKSRFKKKDGRWYYRDGEFLPPLALKRNEPCFCHSGKKYKRCHGK